MQTYRKKILHMGIALGISGLLFGCSDNTPDLSALPDNTTLSFSSQNQLKRFANDLIIRYEVISNNGNAPCHPDDTSSPCFHAKIIVESKQEYPKENWEI